MSNRLDTVSKSPGQHSGSVGSRPERATPGLATLATATASPSQRGFAALLCLACIAGSLALWPHLAEQMPSSPGFLAINQTALTLVYAITSWLLLAQFRRTRSVALLVLGLGNLYTTLAIAAQLLCFPDMLSAGLLIGRGPATLTWLWNFWHVGPPLFAMPYALLERRNPAVLLQRRQVDPVLAMTVAATFVAGALTLLLVTRYVGALPLTSDADGGYRSLTTSGIGPALIGLTAFSLVVLYATTRLRSVLQLWVGVSLALLLCDNVVTDFGAARATLGWFAGRIDALVAGFVVLGVYLHEIDFLSRKAGEAAASMERQRAVAEAARENLEIALEASGMGDWELDLESDTSRRTLRHDRLFGYDTVLPSWGRAQMMQHVHPDDRAGVQASFERAVQSGKLDVDCRIVRHGDRAVRWIAVHGRTYYGADGRPASMAGCILDVTERRMADAKLREAERMEALGQLTGGVAHDFNNLLTILLSSLDMIARRPEDTRRVARLAEGALTAGRRGADLTDKLLSFSRRQLVDAQLVNVNRLASEFRPLLERAVGEAVTVCLDLDPNVDPTRIDPTQLQSALLNLAGNARDAMPSGGTLTLETRNVSLEEADLTGAPDVRPGSYVRMTVRDTGVGMDPKVAARAFEPFFTTKEVGKGTGLGLSQVYGFARQAGGHCRLRTEPGAGCSADIFLPRSAESAQVQEPRDTLPLQRAVNGEVVLVVEDEDTLREMAAESLEALGYGVLTAPDARVALDILRGPSRLDILFSDIVMPGGMNGAQLALAARTIRPDLKVLLTSGYNTTATGGARELPEGVPLLRKPYLRADLAEKLRGITVA